jgi:hypothetical protein
MAKTCFEPQKQGYQKIKLEKVLPLNYPYFLPQNRQLFDFFSKSQYPLIPIFFKNN